jgi:iron complex transport system substrate-binding protein
MRIVSLLPAATEIVWALGLGDDLVGISHACDYPPGVAGRPVVTRPAEALAGAGAHRVHALAAGAAAGSGPPLVEVDDALLAALRPDLVLAGPWAGTMAGDRGRELRAAAGPDASVITLEPTSLEGIFHAIATVGAMSDAEDEAVGLVEILRERLADVEEVVEERRDGGHHAPRVVALDWLDPLFSAGLWVPEQIRRAGGWEVLAVDGEPSARTTWGAVIDVDPEMILLLPCGMHLAETVRSWRAAPRARAWDQVQAVRRGQVFALDASAYFSRPGPRVIDGIELLAEIFDPAAFVDMAPAGSWVPVP